jgi:hypothetical protein
MPFPMCSARLLYWTSLLFWTWALADQTVYLDRPLDPLDGPYVAEPYFNPATISANVGEQVHFVARFQDQRPHSRQVFSPLVGTHLIRGIYHLNGFSQNQVTLRPAFITKV